jgi:hypothetical protein
MFSCSFLAVIILEHSLNFVKFFSKFLNQEKGSDRLKCYDNIKDICKKRGLSIRYVEQTAGLSNGIIAKWNDSSPTAENLKAVADVLKVKVDTLMN